MSSSGATGAHLFVLAGQLPRHRGLFPRNLQPIYHSFRDVRLRIDTLALDKLLGDGPELLSMISVQSIRHIASEG
jgi:hypothetical protein